MPIDQPDEEESTGGHMSFLDHLEVLRGHIIRSLIAVVVFAIGAFIFSDVVFDGILLAPKYPDFLTYRLLCQISHAMMHDKSLCMEAMNFDLINTSMAGQFNTHMKISFVSGLTLAFPYLLWEIWRFIKPALKQKERKHASGLVFWGSLLFFIGLAFGYYVISPMSIYFLGNYQVSQLVENKISLGSFIDLVVTTSFGSAIVFELPIVIFFLTKTGILGSETLKKSRKVSYVVILIIAAIITPPDVTSQIVVSIPLFILYEVSIAVARRIERQRRLDS